MSLERDSLNKHLFFKFYIQVEARSLRHLRWIWVLAVPQISGSLGICLFILFFFSFWISVPSTLVLVVWWRGLVFLAVLGTFLLRPKKPIRSQWPVEIRGYSVNKTPHRSAFHYVRRTRKSVILYHSIKLGMFSVWPRIKLIFKPFHRTRSRKYVLHRAL